MNLPVTRRPKKILADAFADYNQERIHSAIRYMTPVEFASQWYILRSGVCVGTKKCDAL